MKKKADGQQEENLDFNHPICHFINGERLYYVLLSVNTHVFKVGEQLGKLLEKNGLSRSSCGYYLFGESDILLRLWGAEQRVTTFKKDLSEIKEIGRKPSFYLISSMETWYQRDIEAEPGWMSCLTTETIENIMSGDVPDQLRYESLETKAAFDSKKLTRFFVFVRDHSGKNKTLMTELRHRFRNNKEDLFVPRHFISLYSTYSEQFTGVLVKGQTMDFPKVAPLLVKFAQEQKDQQRFTTTYICSERIKTEGNSMCEPGEAQTPKDPRSPIILRNLLISDGCNQEIIEAHAGRNEAAAHFIDLLSRDVNLFFQLRNCWWPYIKDFRFLFKWCVLKDNDQLHSFLMRHYAKLEYGLREIIWPAYSLETIQVEGSEFRKLLKKIRKECEEFLGGNSESLNRVEEVVRKVAEPSFRSISLVTEEQPMTPEEKEKEKLRKEEEKRKLLTLGAIAVYLGKKKAQIGGDEKDIQNFSLLLQECSQQRNLLAHGTLQELTANNQKEKTFQWEKPVTSYIKLMLLWPRVEPLVRSFVTNKQAELQQAITTDDDTEDI